MMPNVPTAIIKQTETGALFKIETTTENKGCQPSKGGDDKSRRKVEGKWQDLIKQQQNDATNHDASTKMQQPSIKWQTIEIKMNKINTNLPVIRKQ